MSERALILVSPTRLHVSFAAPHPVALCISHLSRSSRNIVVFMGDSGVGKSHLNRRMKSIHIDLTQVAKICATLKPYTSTSLLSYPSKTINGSSSTSSSSSTLSTKTKPSKPLSLETLILSQRVNGSFKPNDIFPYFFQGVRGRCPKRSTKGLSPREVDAFWATCLGLALLSERYTNDSEEWELIANKSKEYLRRVVRSEAMVSLALHKATDCVVVL